MQQATSSDAAHAIEAAALRERLQALERENDALRLRLEQASILGQMSSPDKSVDRKSSIETPSESFEFSQVHFASDVQVAQVAKMGDDGTLAAHILDDDCEDASLCSPGLVGLHRPSTAVPPLIHVGGKASPLSVLTNRAPVFGDLKGLMSAFSNSARAADASNRMNTLISVSTAYDQSFTGGPAPAGTAKGKATATEGSLQQIFLFYAARQSIADAGNGTVSFEDIMRANTTMSKAELNKFLDDMIAYSVPRDVVRSVFLVANCTEGVSDENTSELNFEEFCLSLIKISVYIFHDDEVLFPDLSSRKLCVTRMAEHLNLDNALKTAKYLKYMARANAGFGSWKMPPEESVDAQKDRKIRVRRTMSLSRLLPTDREEEKILVGELLSRSQAKSKISWQTFPSCYIGMHIPSHVGKRVLLSVTVRNKSSNSMSFLPKMRHLPLCFKFLPPHKCPPGMGK